MSRLLYPSAPCVFLNPSGWDLVRRKSSREAPWFCGKWTVITFYLFIYLNVCFCQHRVCPLISECPSVPLSLRPQLDLDQILPLPRSLDRKQIQNSAGVFFLNLNNLMTYMFTFCLLYWSNKLLMQPGCKSVFMLKFPTPVFTVLFFSQWHWSQWIFFFCIFRQRADF